MTEETDRVELVDEAGRSVGTAGKLEAHTGSGLLHRGFSVFLFDEAGRVLLQRRADGKYHFAGRWSNACCSHPVRGVDVAVTARARLRFELGLEAEVVPVGSFRYRAADDQSNLVEWEDDTVLVGYVGADVACVPNPAEVAEVRLVSVEQLRAEMADRAGAFTPWLAGALECAAAAGHPRASGVDARGSGGASGA